MLFEQSQKLSVTVFSYLVQWVAARLHIVMEVITIIHQAFGVGSLGIL